MWAIEKTIGTALWDGKEYVSRDDPGVMLFESEYDAKDHVRRTGLWGNVVDLEARPDLHLVFVYGTLKRGFPNSYLLEGQTFVQTSVTKPLYRLLGRGIPFLMEHPEQPGIGIEGEVWEVTTRVLNTLDRLEGHPHMYRRKPVQLADFNEPIETYFWQGDVRGAKDISPVYVGRNPPSAPKASEL